MVTAAGGRDRGLGGPAVGGAVSNSESYVNGVSSGLARVGPVVLMVLSPLLLRPELFPGALPVTLGAVTIAIVLAILAQGRDRWMAMLIGGLASATLLGWQRASNVRHHCRIVS